MVGTGVPDTITSIRKSPVSVTLISAARVIGDLGDILFMPIVSDGKLPADLRSEFSHGQERSKPGYYSVNLLKNEIRVELSATSRVGLHKYTYQVTRGRGAPAVVIDLGSAFNWDSPTDTYIKVENATPFQVIADRPAGQKISMSISSLASLNRSKVTRFLTITNRLQAWPNCGASE